MGVKKILNNLRGIIGLSWSLTKANFKLRNEGSYLGLFWYLLYPLLMFVILFTIKGALYKNTSIEFYPAYLMLGLIVYNFITGTLSSSINLMLSNKHFIKSMNINKNSLILANVLQTTFSHVFEFFLFFVLLLITGVPLINIFFYPLVFILIFFFLIGISSIFSIIGSYIYDLKNIWTIVSGILLFVTPVAFIIQKNTSLETINQFNPLYYYITLSRELIIYSRIPSQEIIWGAIICSLVFFIIGTLIFNKFKRKLAEVV
ncbi:hypothetical protein FJZ17_03315 [Candidatus Pacearchaeota archaeon]|nr:hypothetical protein [Candidatus Pacearchaeota archaeon]